VHKFLTNASVFNSVSWPNDPLDLAMHGNNEIVALCGLLGVDSETSLEILSDFTVYKRTKRMGARLAQLYSDVQTFPLSTAAYERGFSQMNLIHTAGRNRLSTDHISSSLMISINGPPLQYWNAEKYVISWLQKGKHGALDKATGVSRKNTVISKSSELFL
jgi:hypothetical protein